MRWIVFVLLVFLLGCGSDREVSESGVTLEAIDKRHFQLGWDSDSAILKIQKNYSIQVIQQTQEVPKPIMALVQSLAWLTDPEYQASFKMHKHFKDVQNISEETSLFRLTYFTIIYAFKLKNLNVLESIDHFVSENFKQYGTRQYTRLKSLMYFYMAILEENWTKQKTYLLKAVGYESQDRTLKHYAQIFSLSVLKMSIKYYKDEIEKIRYYRKLGMEEALEDGSLQFGEIVGQTIKNTFNLIRYNIPQYQDHHEQIIQKHIHTMESYLQAIDVVLQEVKKGRLLSEIDTDKIIQEYPQSENFFLSQAYTETKNRGIFFDYVISGRRVSLPTLQSLQLYELKEYLYPYWNDRIISEGVNMWSILLLVKGPQIVEVVFGLRGIHTHVKIMSLRSLWTQPWEWTKTTTKAFGFWIKAETLDGCLPTWAFIIGSAFTPDANNDIDHGIPFIDQNYNKSLIPTKAKPGTFGL